MFRSIGPREGMVIVAPARPAFDTWYPLGHRSSPASVAGRSSPICWLGVVDGAAHGAPGFTRPYSWPAMRRRRPNQDTDFSGANCTSWLTFGPVPSAISPVCAAYPKTSVSSIVVTTPGVVFSAAAARGRGPSTCRPSGSSVMKRLPTLLTERAIPFRPGAPRLDPPIDFAASARRR